MMPRPRLSLDTLIAFIALVWLAVFAAGFLAMQMVSYGPDIALRQMPVVVTVALVAWGVLVVSQRVLSRRR